MKNILFFGYRHGEIHKCYIYKSLMETLFFLSDFTSVFPSFFKIIMYEYYSHFIVFSFIEGDEYVDQCNLHPAVVGAVHSSNFYRLI